MEIETRLWRLEQELERIRENTSSSWLLILRNGFLQGAGFIIGSVLIVALLGWVLSLAGVIPGISDIAQYLHQILRVQSGAR